MNVTERGAALAVTLVLLGGLGTLALTAAGASIAALALAGHQQSAQQAFEAAEAGLAHALVLAGRSRGTGTIGEMPYPDTSKALASVAALIEDAEPPGALPAGFSVGEHSGAFAARPYFAIADARASRGAQVRLEQGFYLVVPRVAP